MAGVGHVIFIAMSYVQLIFIGQIYLLISALYMSRHVLCKVKKELNQGDCRKCKDSQHAAPKLSGSYKMSKYHYAVLAPLVRQVL